jgi:hypothetical protein
MKIFFLLLSVISIIDSCAYKSHGTPNKFIIGPINFSASPGTKLIEEKGIDSYAADLVDETGDTLFIEYGQRNIIYNFYKPNTTIFPLDMKAVMIKRDGKVPSPDAVLFSEYPKEDQEENIFEKNYFMYDTINKIVVKIVQPKRIGDGIIGMYIPKLKDGNSFSIYAHNPDSICCTNSLKIFHSVRYKYE